MTLFKVEFINDFNLSRVRFRQVSLYVNIFYIKMSKLNKNRVNGKNK